MTEVTPTSSRKSDHIRINLTEDVRSDLTNGLEHYHFVHQALPDLDLDTVDLNLELFGRHLRAPILISSMTGGTAEAAKINFTLARAAQEHGLAMGLGSLRAAIEDPALAATYQVRRVAPDILLFANLGAVQLNYGYGIDECLRAVEMVQADALILHLNP
jgi:isopentenyl-diphosphate delta-isomerase